MKSNHNALFTDLAKLIQNPLSLNRIKERNETIKKKKCKTSIQKKKLDYFV